MSVAPSPRAGPTAEPAPPQSEESRALHRIRQVRQQQNMSLRAVARQTGIDVRQLREEEQETSDLPLSVLCRWAEALDVPVSELLTEPGTSLSAPVNQRAQLVRLMKTAAAICEESAEVGVHRMAQTLVEQLIEIMPELEHVGGWHTIGQRRSLEEYGRAVERCISDDLLFRYRPD